MTLNFPLDPPLDDIFDPGNGIKYQWDGSQWSQLETTLKTIYPIDLDIGSSAAVVQKNLTTFSGSKDFTYINTKCGTNTISTNLAVFSGISNPNELQWKGFTASAGNYGQGFIFVSGTLPDNNWPNPGTNHPPYIYIDSPSLTDQLKVEILDGSNASGMHWYYYTDPYILDTLVGENVTMTLCDSQDVIDDDEFENGKSGSSYPSSIDHFTFKDNTIGISELVNTDELYATEKLTGKIDTYSIDGVTVNANGTVRVDVTVKNYNTGYQAYADGKVFNFSYNVDQSAGDTYTHFIDLTTITKI